MTDGPIETDRTMPIRPLPCGILHYSVASTLHHTSPDGVKPSNPDLTCVGTSRITCHWTLCPRLKKALHAGRGARHIRHSTPRHGSDLTCVGTSRITCHWTLCPRLKKALHAGRGARHIRHSTPRHGSVSMIAIRKACSISPLPRASIEPSGRRGWSTSPHYFTHTHDLHYQKPTHKGNRTGEAQQS
jgi:hypothetical protein